MSNTSTNISIDLNQVSIILSIMEKYIMVFLYIFGFIGSLLNIFIFLQKYFRIKSCSIYFLIISIIDFCYINSFILMQLISLFNSKIFSSINSTNIWCKFGNFFYFLLPCLSSTYLIFASFDRYCSSSSNNKLYKFNQLKISYIIIIIIFLIWSLFSLHIPIIYDHIRSNLTNSIQCTTTSNILTTTIIVIIDGYFFALYNGIIVPFILIIFGLLIYRNVQLIHRRINPQLISMINNNKKSVYLTRSNRNLIKILLFQVSLNIILNIPYIVLYLYGFYNTIPNYALSLLFYKIFSSIGRWFLFMNYCKTFYINILSSQIFRNIFKEKILQLLGFIHLINYQNNLHQSNPIIISQEFDSSLNSNLEFISRTQNLATSRNIKKNY